MHLQATGMLMVTRGKGRKEMRSLRPWDEGDRSTQHQSGVRSVAVGVYGASGEVRMMKPLSLPADRSKKIPPTHLLLVSWSWRI